VDIDPICSPSSAEYPHTESSSARQRKLGYDNADTSSQHRFRSLHLSRSNHFNPSCHLVQIDKMRSRPIHQLLHLRRTPVRPLVIAHLPSRLVLPATAIQPSSFHTSPLRQQERSNLPPQSPFKVFVQTLKEEIQKNRELQDDVKKLQGDVDKLADSEAMKKAREAYERSRVRHCP
jgi:hypothetical protein